MDTVCATLAFIDGVGAPEMLLIFVIVLVLFGGQKLPEFARGLGKSIREFKKAAAGVEEEFKRALEEDERKNATPQIAPPATPDTSHDYTHPDDPVPDPAGPDATQHTPVTADEITQAPEVPPDPSSATPAASSTTAPSPAAPEASTTSATPPVPPPAPATPPPVSPPNHP